jgi:hypothetical protein
LDHYPNTREELKENPAAFVRRENACEKHEGEPTRRRSDIPESELRKWDNYSDKHCDVETRP